MWQRRLLIALPIVIAGCGGGGGGGVGGTVPVSVAIHWGARTRELNGPSSALSAKLTLLGAAADSGDVFFVVNRDANPSGYTAAVRWSLDARPGRWQLRAEFRALADGQGDVVGTAQADVLLKGGSPLLTVDGKPLPAIATSGRVASIRLLGRQTVVVGGDVDLQASAYSGDYELIAVTPGSFTFQAHPGNGAVVLEPSGHAHGTQPGIVFVSVSMDGLSTDPGPIYVLPQATIRTVSLNATNLAWDSVSKRLFASIPGSEGPINGNTIAVINPSTAEIERYLPVSSDPGRMVVTDNGQFLYVYLKGAGAVQRISIPTLTADLRFSVGYSDEAVPLYVDLATLSGNPHAVAVSSAYGKVAVYDDGIMRHDVIDQGKPLNIASITIGADSTRLYGGYWTSTGATGLVTMDVDAAGVRVKTVSDGLLYSATDYSYPEPVRYFGGRIYAANGVVIDPGSQAIAGSLALAGHELTTDTNAHTVDTLSGRAYYFVNGGAESSSLIDFSHLILKVFDTSRLAQVSRIDLFEGLRVTEGVACGAGVVAFAATDYHTPSKAGIYLVSDLKE